LARSKISLNTSKPPKKKNVQNVEAQNFAVDWHLKFGEIRGENALEGALFLFTDAENLTVLAWRSCSNSWTEPLQVFVKVVEGCLIFNFASDPKVQFSLKNWRKAISKTDQ
jgi:hypothetical protein